MPITTASPTDIPALVALMNSAYRGEASKKGWTTEADMVSGELRTDEPAMHELMSDQDAVFLKYVNDQNIIEGCVYLQKKGNRLYLGMLSVSPLLQAKGTGKQLMKAAEQHAIQNNCNAIFMRVISIRHELIDWYRRQGYEETGVKETFNAGRFGTPTSDFHFLLMEKKINGPGYNS